ncbi:MAG: SNF2-related protein [Nitrospirota bacterium]
MLLNNLKFLERAKLNLVSKIFPVKKTELILLDQLEITLKEAKISQVKIPSISLPQVGLNFCPVRPAITGLKTLLENQVIEDFTLWLREQLLCPEIESFSVLLDTPRKTGKSYQQSETEGKKATLFELEKDKDCIHGLKKSWCAICIQKERQERERTSSHVDLFDLILPLLQPPLGENFDSPIAFPLGMELYPFQRIGVKFLTEHERALLGDEMGLGKTQQAIIALRFLFRMGKITNGLIICPRSVLTHWERTLWDWAPELRLIKVRGSKEQRQINWNCPAHIYLTTYETLRQDLDGSLKDIDAIINSDGGYSITCPNDGCSQRLRIDKEIFGIQVQCPTCNHLFTYTPAEDIARKQFDLLVLDEIQKIKNPGAAITKAVRQINASYRWGLSGTPLENRLEELISIFAYLKPGLLHYDYVARPLEVVKEAIRPYFLRRRKADALPELPEKVCEETWLELSPAQREAYDRAEQEGVIALNEKGDSVTVQHILALITKLKQICNMEPASKESCKLEYLLEKLEEISEQDDKALVFSQYPEKTLKFIEPELKQFNPFVYHGSLSDSQRDEIVKKFQEDEQSKVLLMSVKAGGLGLTLTRANFVFHFDLWWNPSIAAQAEDRSHRIGQKKTVFVTSLFTVDTIEERIQNLLKRKRELFKAVIDDLSDTNLSRVLTEEELFSLFNIQKTKPTTAKGMPRGGLTIESLGQILPQQFERLIANLYEKMGYQVKLTTQTKDQGIDIHAKRLSETGTEYLAIQCKHYPNGVVGVEHARSLYGVIQDQPSITKGVLVTSGEFSRECKEFARGKRIELFNGKYLCGLFEKYGISFSGKAR